MSVDFVHLHLHSDFSMLDGACRVDKLCEKVQSLGQSAVAVTDHGSMFGTLELYWAARKVGIKPIIGCEFYVAPNGIADHTSPARYHLVLLAKNYEGYQNLCRLNAIAWSKEGFYYKARVDHDILQQYSEGLICTTACIAGEVPRQIINGKMDAAREALEFYMNLYGKENFFLEVQDHGIEEERLAMPVMRDLAEEYGIGLVATNDAHYINQEDFNSHDALLCIGTQSQLTDERRFRFSGDHFYVKTGEEMAELFKDYPGAVENTVKIAEMCDCELPVGDTKVSHYPVFRLDNESDDAKNPNCPIRLKALRDICLEGLMPRYDLKDGGNPDYVPAEDEPTLDERKAILDRMDYELSVIDRMGYVSYFLVVWDFIKYARAENIPVGPGRGSGAGSLVAYATGITNMDPLRYGLLFERFLNPDRVSPPDFDIDFCERRRGEVIDYVRDKYGNPSVAQIGTFGTLKAKAVLKDVARVMGVPFEDANRVVAMIPTDPKMTLEKAFALPEIKQQYDSLEWVRKMFELAQPLEGLNRNSSIHACGVIIGDMPLANVVPLSLGSGKEVITQYPAYPCEELGLLKMDFLGLRTLTIIQDTVDQVNATTDAKLDPDEIPLEDQNTYDLLNRGETLAVFQLESGGMQDLCRKFKISKLEEIIALVALYRPGPMEFIPTYINCKLGLEKPEYETKEMKEILSETYGIMVYQEQIMQVVQAVAGFSLAQADIMRRAIGKKKESVLIEQGEKFREGCVAQGHSLELADGIWQKILKFASYGFNKSHSACYGLMSYRTAYLKANYPAQFMAAVLNAEINNAEKMSFYLAECRRMHIQVLPPSVNVSNESFGVDGKNIRFGLAGIKGMGSGPAELIMEAREKEGKFSTILEFCERVDVKKRGLESLCKAGAFDEFGLKRSQTFQMIDDVLQRVSSTRRDREAGQETFFDMMVGDESDKCLEDVQPPDIDEWRRSDLLSEEKALLGFYVTGHPLDDAADLLTAFSTHSILPVRQFKADKGVRIGGLITSVAIKISKRDGRSWAIIGIEDMDGTIECLCYSESYAKFQEHIRQDAKVFIEGYVNRREDDDISTIVVNKVVPFEASKGEFLKEIHVTIDEGNGMASRFGELKSLLSSNPGPTPVVLALKLKTGDYAFVEAGRGYYVELTDMLECSLKSMSGRDRLVLKGNHAVEDRKPRRWSGNQSTS